MFFDNVYPLDPLAIAILIHPFYSLKVKNQKKKIKKKSKVKIILSTFDFKNGITYFILETKIALSLIISLTSLATCSITLHLCDP
jgi:hypothetical protein